MKNTIFISIITAAFIFKSLLAFSLVDSTAFHSEVKREKTQLRNNTLLKSKPSEGVIKPEEAHQKILSPLVHSLPLNEGFETDFTKFSNAAGNTVDWGISTSYFHSGSKSVRNVSTINNENILVETEEMDLTGANDVFLEFWHIAKTEANFDKCFVEISTDNGVTFNAIPSSAYQGATSTYASKGYFDENSYIEWNGTNDVVPDNGTWWKKEKFSLSNYTTGTCKIRFRLSSDFSINRIGGWIIDDIKVTQRPVTKFFVDASKASNGDGLSWGTAFKDLQNALDAAANLDTIWVAAGTYYPTESPDGTTADPRDRAFHFTTKINLYGGFNGTEIVLSQRNIKTNKTILSGDFNNNDLITGQGDILNISGNVENAYHVMVVSNSAGALIDGFTIKRGNANVPDSYLFYQSLLVFRYTSPALYLQFSTIHIQNTIVEENASSVGQPIVYLETITANSSMTNMTFRKNSGGAITLSYSNILISSCRFTGNNGHGISSGTSVPIIRNCIFDFNAGFSINLRNKSYHYPLITNCTFYGNGTTAINAYDTAPIIRNCIFQNNTLGGNNNVPDADIKTVVTNPEFYVPTVEYCLTQLNSTYSSGIGIINNENPLFYNATAGDFRLLATSPALDAGNNDAAAVISTDYAGNARRQNGTVDIGAYEGAASIPTRVYVNKSAAGANNGTSWADAFINLQDAIDFSSVGTEIWVAAGTYYPTKDHVNDDYPNDPRYKNFHLATDMNIYGGFAGNEPLLNQRNWVTKPTILSGDFLTNDNVSGSGATLSITNNTENAYHVLITANLSNNARIDGFTIKGGYADDLSHLNYGGRTFVNDIGGGMFNNFSDVFIGNTTYIGNATEGRGGGIHNKNSNPTLSNNNFDRNWASSDGGGLENLNSSPSVINSTFQGNSAGVGGGMFNNSSSPNISNTIFQGNSASSSGGGMYNNSASYPSISNSTFQGNSADESGGGIYNLNSSAIIKNVILWQNKKGGADNVAGADIENDGIYATVTYSLTQAGSIYSSGTGIINNQDPLFVDAANKLLQLQCNSPSINMGTLTGAPTTDITGFARTGNPDMGAYEYGQAEVNISIPNARNPNLSGMPSLKASSQILNTNTVLYKGINNVQLLPGFSVAPAAGQATVFRAEIGPCLTAAVSTLPISSPMGVSAMSGGTVVDDGGLPIIGRGICWGTDHSPTTAGPHTTDGLGFGTFTSNLTGLSIGTVYYIRAYATNSSGTYYGSEISYTAGYLPTLTTVNVTGITTSTASSGGNISADGGTAITARGVCWSTSSNPVVTNSHTNDGTGSGSFTSQISGLLPGTTYYVRSYATNGTGTAYGNQINFTTSLAIGNDYQGGKVAYIFQPGDPGYVAGQVHGLIAAPSDQGLFNWGCNGTSIAGASGTAIGSGAQNTIDIVSNCGQAGIAAKVCADLSLNNYDDWYLPSTLELTKVMENSNAIGDFHTTEIGIPNPDGTWTATVVTAPYWTSTQIDSFKSYFFFGSIVEDNGPGEIYYPSGKSIPIWVRAVRTF